MEKIIINNIELDRQYIDQLLMRNQRIEAVKYVFDTAKIGLKSSKEFIDDYIDGKQNEGRIDLTVPVRESVQIRELKNTILVTYTDKQGVATEVNPDHPHWFRVKEMMRDSLKIHQYENDFYANKQTTTHNNYAEVPEKPKFNFIPYLIFIAIILFVLAYFFK